MVFDKILRYLSGKNQGRPYIMNTSNDNDYKKNDKYILDFLPSKEKDVQRFPDNNNLDRERDFVLNGDASNIRPTARMQDSTGEDIEQWTVDGNKVRLTLFNGKTFLKKSQENEIILEMTGFGDLEKKGSWVHPQTDFLNVIWGMYVQRKEGTKNGFSFFSRSLRHNKEIHGGMGGTSYKGNLDIEGFMSVKKEIWHTGGYQFSKKYKVTEDDIFDKRIGYAVGLFNFLYDDQKKGVCITQFLDEQGDGSWELKYQRCDKEDTGWGKRGEFGGEKFGGKYDQLITWGSPKVSFRWDNSVTWFDSPFAYEFEVTDKMINSARNAPLIEPR